MSPEVINGKEYDDRVDIWAMVRKHKTLSFLKMCMVVFLLSLMHENKGVTTIEMMNKQPPYSGFPKTKALFLITSQGIPLSHFNTVPKWSAALKDWLAKVE